MSQQCPMGVNMPPPQKKKNMEPGRADSDGTSTDTSLLHEHYHHVSVTLTWWPLARYELSLLNLNLGCTTLLEFTQ